MSDELNEKKKSYYLIFVIIWCVPPFLLKILQIIFFALDFTKISEGCNTIISPRMIIGISGIVGILIYFYYFYKFYKLFVSNFSFVENDNAFIILNKYIVSGTLTYQLFWTITEWYMYFDRCRDVMPFGIREFIAMVLIFDLFQFFGMCVIGRLIYKGYKNNDPYLLPLIVENC